MSKFSDRLKELKSANNTTQKNIADNIGISLRGYQYYETDTKEPTMTKLIAIADYFNVSIDYLVGRTDNPNINK